MTPKVYIETSIVSYLTANPSRDVTTFVRQQSTVEWWNLRRQNYDVCISQFVSDESSKGDAIQAQERCESRVRTSIAMFMSYGSSGKSVAHSEGEAATVGLSETKIFSCGSSVR